VHQAHKVTPLRALKDRKEDRELKVPKELQERLLQDTKVLRAPMEHQLRVLKELRAHKVILVLQLELLSHLAPQFPTSQEQLIISIQDQIPIMHQALL
jgi:hypothetical protein